MPREEVPRVVDRLRLVDVRADEIVEPGFSAGRCRRWSASGLGLEALHGVYIGFLFIV